MMKKFLYILISLAFAQNMSLGECITGYACPLRDLNDQKAVINKIEKEKVNNYYNPDTERTPQSDKTERGNITLKDLIPFNPRFIK